MAFKLERSIDAPNFDVNELYPTTASETYVVGEILTLSTGALTKAGVDSDGTQMFVCQEAYVAPATGMKEIAVTPLKKEHIYRTTVGATPTSLKVGNKVTLGSGAVDVTATTTKGVAEIVDLCGAAASGDEVLVRFV